MDAFKEIVMKIPPVTRYFTAITFFFSMFMTYKLLNPYYIILDFESLFYKFQVLIDYLIIAYRFGE
jgi:hypothetical protein